MKFMVMYKLLKPAILRSGSLITTKNEEIQEFLNKYVYQSTIRGTHHPTVILTKE